MKSRVSKSIQCVFLTLIFINLLMRAEVKSEKVPSKMGKRKSKAEYNDSKQKEEGSKGMLPIGVIFDQNTDEIQELFNFVIHQHNTNKTGTDFQLNIDLINTADAFKLSRLICSQFSSGVVGMMVAVNPESFDTLHSYANTFQMPLITPWFPEKVIPPSSGLVDYAISIRPDYHKAVIDTITYYGWRNVIYVYDSHDGLLRLQQLYQSLQPGNTKFRISNVKRVSSASDVVKFLMALERLDRWSTKYVVLDCAPQLAKDTLVAHVRSVHLGRRNYHYFLSGLVMDDRWKKEVSEFTAINITGFRILDLSKRVVQNFFRAWRRDGITAQTALIYDAIQVLIDAILRLIRKKPDFVPSILRRYAFMNYTNVLDCNPKKQLTPYDHGEKISKLIKKTELEGLSGPIRFTEIGHRKNFTLQVVEMNINGDVVKIGTWYDYKGLVPLVPKSPSTTGTGRYDRNKTYIVTTIEEPPYLMKQIIEGELLDGNEAFKGFCADLTRMIANKMDIKYALRVVRDHKYGDENPTVVGGWDGIIGELVRKDADFAVAPLLVTLEREMAVIFSKPFLSFNTFSNKNEVKHPANIFSFLHPLSIEIWICILLSLFAVTIVLFLVSRFSPYEWRLISESPSSDNTDGPSQAVVNEFNIWNSLWFSLGSFMQQGSEITPRSLSGRIVGTVWWFFTLIVISSYTANLASYFTLTKMTEPNPSYSKITPCPEDSTVGPKPTEIASDIDTDHGWFNFLIDKSNKNDGPCEMKVTITSSGSKDFAIAFPKGSSQLRDGVNIALQSLKDDGELQKLVRQWFTKAECQLNEVPQGSEITLGQVAGLFYVLLGGLALALGVALVEFCQHGRAEAARANVPFSTALKAKVRLTSRSERKASNTQRNQQRENDRLGWNGTAYGGQYYSPANQIEETALHSNFTQV